MTVAAEVGGELWQLTGTQARLSCGALRATIDLAAPSAGMSELEFRAAPLGGSLAGLVWDEGPAASGSPSPIWPTEAYVRGADLVALYRETPARRYSVHAYWSLAAPTGTNLATLDATLSLQTRQWEAYPRLSVISRLSADLEILNPSGIILRPVGSDWSLVQASLPEDFQLLPPTELGAEGSAAAWTYGGHFMERGVIRRLRLRTAWVERDGDRRALETMQLALAAEQPPLTA
ncbi:MAG TPA: hypothetical protein VEQ85_01885 [Lacipirellulaceae bacterium]|nr:hypothetical protein [Lacipirellulaceae bacterium]